MRMSRAFDDKPDFVLRRPRVKAFRSSHRRLSALWRLARIALLLSPSLFAAAYYGAIASDQYVSETRFFIRTATKPSATIGGLSSLLEMVGISRSQDDAWAVHDYLTSRDALRELSARLDLRAIYGAAGADLLARYPSMLFGGSEERLYRYFQHMLTVIIASGSGLTTLRVDAFQASDAQKVAATLLDLGEDLVNKLNERSREDTVRVAESEVVRAEQRRIISQQAITAFRNRELLLDPEKSSAVVLEVIGTLSSELADASANLAEARATAPKSPGLPSLQRRVDALNNQLMVERTRIGSTSDGLADKIAEYEKLSLERDFSIRSLTQAVTSLEQARLDARRQELFLERVVEPGLADYPTMPQRWRMFFTVFGFNLLALALGWLFRTGFREHAGLQEGH